jgi:hypothetical protein
LIYANFPRSYRVFFFFYFSTVSFSPALLLLRRPVMASADAPVMDLIFFFFFTDAAFLHITPFFVNPSVYSFFFIWSCRPCAASESGTVWPVVSLRLVLFSGLAWRQRLASHQQFK